MNEAEAVRTSAPRTTCAFDNLRAAMREVFYKLEEQGRRPTHGRADRRSLTGYESLCEQNDPPVTTFKGIPITLNPYLPEGRLEFWRDGTLVGIIEHIS